MCSCGNYQSFYFAGLQVYRYVTEFVIEDGSIESVTLKEKGATEGCERHLFSRIPGRDTKSPMRQGMRGRDNLFLESYQSSTHQLRT